MPGNGKEFRLQNIKAPIPPDFVLIEKPVSVNRLETPAAILDASDLNPEVVLPLKPERADAWRSDDQTLKASFPLIFQQYTEHYQVSKDLDRSLKTQLWNIVEGHRHGWYTQLTPAKEMDKSQHLIREEWAKGLHTKATFIQDYTFGVENRPGELRALCDFLYSRINLWTDDQNAGLLAEVERLFVHLFAELSPKGQNYRIEQSSSTFRIPRQAIRLLVSNTGASRIPDSEYVPPRWRSHQADSLTNDASQQEVTAAFSQEWIARSLPTVLAQWNKGRMETPNSTQELGKVIQELEIAIVEQLPEFSLSEQTHSHRVLLTDMWTESISTQEVQTGTVDITRHGLLSELVTNLHAFAKSLTEEKRAAYYAECELLISRLLELWQSPDFSLQLEKTSFATAWSHTLDVALVPKEAYTEAQLSTFSRLMLERIEKEASGQLERHLLEGGEDLVIPIRDNWRLMEDVESEDRDRATFHRRLELIGLEAWLKYTALDIAKETNGLLTLRLEFDQTTHNLTVRHRLAQPLSRGELLAQVRVAFPNSTLRSYLIQKFNAIEARISRFDCTML